MSDMSGKIETILRDHLHKLQPSDWALVRQLAQTALEEGYRLAEKVISTELPPSASPFYIEPVPGHDGAVPESVDVPVGPDGDTHKPSASLVSLDEHLKSKVPDMPATGPVEGPVTQDDPPKSVA